MQLRFQGPFHINFLLWGKEGGAVHVIVERREGGEEEIKSVGGGREKEDEEGRRWEDSKLGQTRSLSEEGSYNGELVGVLM